MPLWLRSNLLQNKYLSQRAVTRQPFVMDRSLISEDETHHPLSYTAAVLDHQVQANEYQSTQSKAITSSLSFFSFVFGEYFAASFFDDFLKYALVFFQHTLVVQLPCQTPYTLHRPSYIVHGTLSFHPPSTLHLTPYTLHPRSGYALVAVLLSIVYLFYLVDLVGLAIL